MPKPLTKKQNFNLLFACHSKFLKLFRHQPIGANWITTADLTAMLKIINRVNSRIEQSYISRRSR